MIDLVSGMSVWLLALLFLLFIFVTSELGYRHGRRSRSSSDADTRSWITTIAAAVLSVLGLLLGFTMSMAVSRYDTRRNLVLEEANAIGTSFWRAQLVPAPAGPEMMNLLREYASLRAKFGEGRITEEQIKAAREQSSRLQTGLWSRASAYAQTDPRSATAGLLLQTLNQTFDLEESRWIAFRAHVPKSVIAADALVALLATVLVGYSLGLVGRRNFFHLSLLALCITLVLTVIVDLDEPRQGLIRVSQQPLLDVEQQMGPPTR